MINRNIFYIVIATALLLSSCATTGTQSVTTTPPVWASQGIDAVYPQAQFIAQEGRGAAREDAEANAAANIARFLQSQIETTSGYTQSATQVNGKTTETLKTTNEAYVKSQLSLFGIRYADDTFYDRPQKLWRTVAYINRAEAWLIYEPQFKRQAQSFMNMFNAAEKETGAFKKTLRYISAQNYAQSPQFTDANFFGQLLYPAKMNSEFADVRAALGEIPEALDSAKRAASVYIDCKSDDEGLLNDAFSAAFAAQGYPVAKSRAGAAAVCAVAVDEGRTQNDVGVFYRAKLQAVITENGVSLFTFDEQGGKEAAVTPSVAKRRAYQDLANKIKSQFQIRGDSL
jgi:hypothetical protein